MRHSLQFPGIFTATGQPEAVLYPSNTNRTRSTDLEKGVLSPRQHRPDGMRQEFDTVMADTQTIARQNSAQDATYGGLSTFVPPSSLAHNDSTAATQGSNTPQPDRGEQMDQSYVSDNSIHAHAKRTTIGQVETMLPSHSDPVRERASPPARAPVVSWGPGGLAYIVDHSDDSNEAAGAEDANAGASVADQSDNRDTSEGTCSPLSVATQESEGASIQRTGPHTLSIDHIQTLVRIAKASVSTLRLPRSEVHIFDAAGHIRRAGGMYLLSERDMQHMLEAVIQNHHQQQEDTLACSTVAPSAREQRGPQRPKLDTVSHAFIPGNKAGADSATTVSFPTTSYAKSDLQINEVLTISRSPAISSSTTTVISPRSVSRITWEQNHSSLPGLEAERDCEGGAGSTAQLTDRERDLRISAQLQARHFPEPINGDIFVSELRTAGRGPDSLEHEPGLTSFPRLQSRHCSKEWTTKYNEIERATVPEEDHALHQGGGMSQLLSPCLDKNPWNNDNPHFAHSLHGTPDDDCDKVDHKTFDSELQCGSLGIGPVLVDEGRMGTAIGSASHQRRSSVPDGRGKPANETTAPTFLSKIRKGGHMLFHKHHDEYRKEPARIATRSSSTIKGSELPTPYNSLEAELSSVDSTWTKSRTRDSIVRERTPEVPTVDKAGIYHAMTHVCADDTPLTGRSLSPM